MGPYLNVPSLPSFVGSLILAPHYRRYALVCFPVSNFPETLAFTVNTFPLIQTLRSYLSIICCWLPVSLTGRRLSFRSMFLAVSLPVWIAAIMTNTSSSSSLTPALRCTTQLPPPPPRHWASIPRPAGLSLQDFTRNSLPTCLSPPSIPPVPAHPHHTSLTPALLHRTSAALPPLPGLRLTWDTLPRVRPVLWEILTSTSLDLDSLLRRIPFRMLHPLCHTAPVR